MSSAAILFGALRVNICLTMMTSIIVFSASLLKWLKEKNKIIRNVKKIYGLYFLRVEIIAFTVLILINAPASFSKIL